ncbi:cytochrome c peroxidase [Vibrio sinaloensis]|nr:cytochrome c peroxidase [Vibrio sinaloensis]
MSFPLRWASTIATERPFLQRFRDDVLYQELFNNAFPNQQDSFTFPNVIKALAVFNRALISKDSPFDRGTMSSSAMRGQDLFNSEKMECFSLP